MMRECFRDRKWRLMVFRKAMAVLAATLALCALVGGLYGQRVYFTFALCAAGILLAARAWFGYCRGKDGGGSARKTVKVPWMLRRDPSRRAHRPAFRMNSEDFDDDLTPYTVAREEDFPEKWQWAGALAADGLAAAILFAVSFLI